MEPSKITLKSSKKLLSMGNNYFQQFLASGLANMGGLGGPWHIYPKSAYQTTSNIFCA